MLINSHNKMKTIKMLNKMKHRHEIDLYLSISLFNIKSFLYEKENIKTNILINTKIILDKNSLE